MDNANISRVFDTQKCEKGTAPDLYQYLENERPAPDFVLCRDKNGNATAVYGEDIWNYNPYRLSGKAMNLFRFDLLLEGEHQAERRALVDEAKYLLFCIQYYAQAGHTGTIAASTLYGYYQIMKSAVEYCVSLSSNKFIGIITLKDLFSNKRYLHNFLTIKPGGSFKKRTRSICNHLVYIGDKKIGFKSIDNLKINVNDSQQTPVIPTRLYLSLISNLSDDLEALEGKLDKLPGFIEQFRDPSFGRSHNVQKNNKVAKKDLQRTFQQALAESGLEDLFRGELVADMPKTLSGALKAIQYRMRLVLHLYTGMRDQEVMRLPYNCIDEDTISEEFTDEDGKVIVEKRTVTLISTTTKFSGYRQSAAWYAAPDAEKAIKILQLIAKGLASIYGVKTKDCPLFVNPTAVQSPENKISVVDFSSRTRKPWWLKKMVISPSDFSELQASSPEREFHNEEAFQIGQQWSLASHQFRRSLAFYAASSGFVNLPTLKRQFKHLTEMMTRYYSRHFENINSIFGYYNPETKEFDLPQEHIINECQSGVTTGVVDMLVNDLLLSDSKLFGKTGGYIERQKDQLRNGEVLIEDVRSNTHKRVDQGELNYRETLLGGCMKNGKCDSFMLGDITACLTCDDASIKENKIDKQVVELEMHLANYNESEAEHQIISTELSRLNDYKQNRITGEA
jgi:hypothetical protein